MKYIDTHAHLNIDPLLKDSKSYLELNKDIFVNIIGTNKSDSIIALELAKDNDNASCAIGFHPSETYDLSDNDLLWLENTLKNNLNDICGVGEVGLDYHYPETNKTIQKYFFEKQIQLAVKYNKTLILHIRDAHDDAINIIKEMKPDVNIIIHCYSDNYNYAKQYIELGCYISFSGIVTFKNAESLRDVVKQLPIDRILTETDSPWLAPMPHRSKTNEPLNVKYINELLSEILKINIEEFNKILIFNALNALKIQY